MRGHINRKSILHMLVDGGAIMNLMPYSLFKKLGRKDEELIRTNMMVSNWGGGDPRWCYGVCFHGVDRQKQDALHSLLRLRGAR